jgi:hypothetical protein
LTDPAALHEATLLSILHEPLTSTVAALLDLRTAMSLDLHHSNTGVLIMRGVHNLSLKCPRHGLPEVWLIGDYDISRNDQGVTVNIHGILGSELLIVFADAVEIIAGLVNGIGEVADTIDANDIGNYLRTIPHWESDIQLMSRVIK